MIFFGTVSPYLILAAALFPGVAAWWTGRKLAGSPDHPALPELLLARQQRLAMFVAGAMVASLFLGGRHAYWAIPVIGLAITVGGFPLRRALRIETGTVFGHLWRTAKSVFGGLGLWVLLAWTPDIILSIDPRFRILGLGLLPLLLLWERFYQRIWLRLHDASPLVSSELESRIAAINERAGITPPATFRIGGPGTRYMNALAFPSARRPAIGLGNALIELLEPDEAAAIYAHELAHIEHFSRRRIRRLQAVSVLIVVLSVALPFTALRFVPAYAQWVAWLWPVAMLAYLLLRGRSSQRNETDSDLRAAALCGDPEAVVRALIKLHVHAFIPRRWPVDFERNATHPSLARRIQALRGQGSEAVASIGAPTVLRTARAGSVIVFDEKRGYWFDGVPAETPHDLESLRAHASSARSVAWPELIELRVTTQGVERALKATHHNGDTWSVPLAESDIAPMQRALDLVDVRLRRELGRSPNMSVQLVAAATMFAMMLSGSLSVVVFLPAALAIAKPSTAALAALGAMAVVRGLMGIATRDESWILPTSRIALAVTVALGVLALWLAWRRIRRDGKRDGARITLWVIGGAAAALLLAVALAASSLPLTRVVDLPLMGALAVTLLGVAAVLVASDPGRARTWGTAAAVAGVSALAVHLLVDGAMTWKGVTVPASTVAELDRVDFSEQVGMLRLSPSGRTYVVQHYERRNAERPLPFPMLQFSVGTVGSGRRSIDALDVELIDDDHVLVLRSAARGLELTLERADSSSVVWSLPVPELDDPELAVATKDRTWTISGDAVEGDSLVTIAGSATAPEARVRKFTRPDSLAHMPLIVVMGGTRALLPNMDLRGSMMLPLLMTGSYFPRVQLWEAGSVPSRMFAELDGMPGCEPVEAVRSICVTRSSRRTGMWVIDSAGLRALGDVPVAVTASVNVGPGPTLTATHGQSGVLHLDIDAQRARDIALAADSTHLMEARVAGERLAVILQNGAHSRLVVYRVK